MAKKRRRTATTTRIVRVGAPRAASPIIRVSAPRAAPHKRRRHHRRSGGGGGGGSLISNEAWQMAIGGAMYGFAVKSGIIAKLPELPLFGRTGTAAIVLDYWARHGGGQLAYRAARAAAAIAGYQLGSEGKITGDDMSGLDTSGLDTSGDVMLGDATTPGSMAGEDGY